MNYIALLVNVHFRPRPPIQSRCILTISNRSKSLTVSDGVWLISYSVRRMSGGCLPMSDGSLTMSDRCLTGSDGSLTDVWQGLTDLWRLSEGVCQTSENLWRFSDSVCWFQAASEEEPGRHFLHLPHDYNGSRPPSFPHGFQSPPGRSADTWRRAVRRLQQTQSQTNPRRLYIWSTTALESRSGPKLPAGNMRLASH